MGGLDSYKRAKLFASLALIVVLAILVASAYPLSVRQNTTVNNQDNASQSTEFTEEKINKDIQQQETVTEEKLPEQPEQNNNQSTTTIDAKNAECQENQNESTNNSNGTIRNKLSVDINCKSIGANDDSSSIRVESNTSQSSSSGSSSSGSSGSVRNSSTTDINISID